METADILRLPVCGTDSVSAAETVIGWARGGLSRVVLAANVHMVMEAWDDPDLSSHLRRADLSVPDGRPLVWALRLLGVDSGHVRGTDLALEVCRQAQDARTAIGLYGSTPETLKALHERLAADYPELCIPFAVSPPFRPLTSIEERQTAETIADSGARILLVGLGCPSQERWMMEHRGLVPCVMIGVGAAFDFLAGTTPVAPLWMQRAGLEWLFRLGTDPRRLWKRYLKHNPRFVAYFGGQYARHVLRRVGLLTKRL